ncbi:3-dehydroquinate synthase [Aurantivibrio infirmus]
MQTITVDLGDRKYPIFIGPGLINHAEVLKPYIRGEQVCVVTNETVAPIYLDTLLKNLGSYDLAVVTLPDGEQFKTLATFNKIFDVLLEKNHHRTTTLIALGGGVVGDMTGFAAATFQRGVNFIQIPTTLLAQVDSSVGGKTGVNHPLGKNMIGAFHQPQAVLVDVNILQTLPKRELSAGLAEVIKYGLIADAEFFDWLEENIEALLRLDEAAISYAIKRSCEIKADIVAQDEKEAGVRAWLNLGHTFGHAIENAMGYGQWLHGEAVATGMVMAADLSRRLSWLSKKDCDRLVSLLLQANLPIHSPDIDEAHFLQLMAGDKKVLDGKLRLVLLKSIGEAITTTDFPEDKLLETLRASKE